LLAPIGAMAMGGAALGAFIGGATGVAGSAQVAYSTARANDQILNQSPFYNKSLLNADRLNARGEIVLGAHNTRRGG